MQGRRYRRKRLPIKIIQTAKSDAKDARNSNRRMLARWSKVRSARKALAGFFSRSGSHEAEVSIA
jgi:hypothetical protein